MFIFSIIGRLLYGKDWKKHTQKRTANNTEYNIKPPLS